MRNGDQAPAFSLVEVVIAVAVFAVAVTAVLGLLPMVVRESAEASDYALAQSLPASLETDLYRLVKAGSFDSVATSIPVLTSSVENGMKFWASRDGSVLTSALTPGATIAEPDRYFELEVWRFDGAPLALDPQGGALVVYVRASWPLRTLGSSVPIAIANRSQCGWTLALLR